MVAVIQIWFLRAKRGCSTVSMNWENKGSMLNNIVIAMRYFQLVSVRRRRA